MKNMNLKKLLTVTMITVFAVGSLAGCGSKEASGDDAQAKTQEGAKGSGDVTVLTIAAGPLGAGSNSLRVNENDEVDGSDIAVLNEIDARLADYEFQYVATSFDDVLVGLDTGAYDGGLINAFLTAERIEKYAIPQENIGASFIGILALKENAGGITSLDDIVRVQNESGKTFYPMQAGNGLTYIVDIYNEKHPDAPVVFDYTSENTNNDIPDWIVNKRYDYGLLLQESWQQKFEEETGSLYQYRDQVEWIPLQSVGTYPLFNKEKVDQDFLDAFDKALAEMREDGTTTKIFMEYFGYDKFGLTIENLTD